MRSAIEWKNPRSRRADQGRPGVVGPVGRVRDGMAPPAASVCPAHFWASGGRESPIVSKESGDEHPAPPIWLLIIVARNYFPASACDQSGEEADIHPRFEVMDGAIREHDIGTARVKAIDFVVVATVECTGARTANPIGSGTQDQDGSYGFASLS